MNEPLVSVIVPCCNVEKYIRQCLDSLVCQTLVPMEIIAVDDGSTDATGTLLDAFSRLDGRLHVIHQKNGGYGKAMNAGLDAATGRYVGILEADDFCTPYMFTTLASLAVEHDVDMAKGSYWLYWSGDRKKKYADIFQPAFVNRRLEIGASPEIALLPPSLWSAIYRRSLLVENGIRFTETPGASYQDTAFTMKIFCAFKNAWFTPEAFVYYRQDNENSSVHSHAKIFCVCDEFDEAINFARKNNPAMLPYIGKRRFYSYKWNYNRLDWKSRAKFAMRMSRDFRASFKDRTYDRELYTPEEQADYISAARLSAFFCIKKRGREPWL